MLGMGGDSSKGNDDKNNDEESNLKRTHETSDVKEASTLEVTNPIESSSSRVVTAQISRESIVGSSSSANTVVPVAVPQDQERPVEMMEGIRRSTSLYVHPSSSNIQDSMFGSLSSGSNIRPSSVNPHRPSSFSQPRYVTNFTELVSSPVQAQFSYQQQRQVPPSSSSSMGLDHVPIDPVAISSQSFNGGTITTTTTSSSTSIPVAVPQDLISGSSSSGGSSSSSVEGQANITRSLILSINPSSGLIELISVTRSLSVNLHGPHSSFGPIQATTLSHILGSLGSIQAQTNNQQQNHPCSSSMVLPQVGFRPFHLRQELPLLENVGALDLNPPANNNEDDDGEEENEGLDLNLRLWKNDEP